jgi:uncharacterized protein YjbI with pentapeptide repeats
LGAIFSESILQNVSIQSSIFRYANFSSAKLTNLLLQDSDLSNCSMEQCKLKSVQMKDLNLTSDLTTCTISGISANLLDLRGAIIASSQAVDLAGMLGVVIRDGLPGR